MQLNNGCCWKLLNGYREPLKTVVSSKQNIKEKKRLYPIVKKIN